MAVEKEEYASINANTRYEDIGHSLYHSDGVRLNKNDALVVTGLRFFRSHGDDLELLKETYPQTLDALAGFLAIIDYSNGKTTLKDLHKLTTVFHRLKLSSYERTKSLMHKRERCSLVWRLIEQIWYTALDVKNGHPCNAESVYQIFSDNAREWRGPNWQELQRFEQAAKHLVDGDIKGNLFSVTLRDGHVTNLRYLPTPPIPIPQRETVIMAHFHRH